MHRTFHKCLASKNFHRMKGICIFLFFSLNRQFFRAVSGLQQNAFLNFARCCQVLPNDATHHQETRQMFPSLSTREVTNSVTTVFGVLFILIFLSLVRLGITSDLRAVCTSLSVNCFLISFAHFPSRLSFYGSSLHVEESSPLGCYYYFPQFDINLMTLVMVHFGGKSFIFK